jgi:hypothetical protein
MKLFTFFILFISFISQIFGQDLIKLENGKTINKKLYSVVDSIVTLQSITGKIETLSLSEIKFVILENGEKITDLSTYQNSFDVLDSDIGYSIDQLVIGNPEKSVPYKLSDLDANIIMVMTSLTDAQSAGELLIGQGKINPYKNAFAIDFGQLQQKSIFNVNDARIYNLKTGNVATFTSIIPLWNLLSELGYDHYDTFVMYASGDVNIGFTQFIFKRK